VAVFAPKAPPDCVFDPKPPQALVAGVVVLAPPNALVVLVLAGVPNADPADAPNPPVVVVEGFDPKPPERLKAPGF